MNAEKTKNISDAQVAASVTQSSSKIEAAPSSRRFGWVTAVIILVLLLCASGTALWWQQQRFENTGRIVAARLQQIQSQSEFAEQRAREALSLAQSQTEKLNQIDAQVKVARSDFAAIEQSWRAFNYGVDDTLRANEIERLILLANQQLSLTGQAAGSIAALEAAEQALVRFDSPRFAEVGRAIQTDLSRLRATPDVDIAGLFTKLDLLGELLNQAPLLAPGGNKTVLGSGSQVQIDSASSRISADAPVVAAPEQTPAEVKTPNPSNTLTPGSTSDFWSFETVTRWWQQASEQSSKIAEQASSAVTKEFADIVRIRRAVDTQSLLMSEEQSIALRSHLRGLVLSAKLAMMMRQTGLWQTELAQMSGLVNSRYDLESPQTKKVLELIAQLKAAPVVAKLPSLSDSLNAVASLRAKGFTSNQPGN